MIQKVLDLCIPFANDSVMVLLQTGYVLCYMPNIIYIYRNRREDTVIEADDL